MPNCCVKPLTSDGWIRDSVCRWRHLMEELRPRWRPSQQAQPGNLILKGFGILHHIWTLKGSRPSCLMRDAGRRASHPRDSLDRGSFVPSISTEKKVTVVVSGWTTFDTNTTFCTNSRGSMHCKKLITGLLLRFNVPCNIVNGTDMVRQQFCAYWRLTIFVVDGLTMKGAGRRCCLQFKVADTTDRTKLVNRESKTLNSHEETQFAPTDLSAVDNIKLFIM